MRWLCITRWSHPLLRLGTCIRKRYNSSPGHAQRQIMMALAYYLTGFTVTKSYVGITLLFTSLGVLMPIIVYACVSKTSKSIAFLTSLGLCFSLAPFTYIKFFYPDQLYIFFLLASASAGVLYIWSRNAFFIYILTIAGIGLALTRTSGLLFISLSFFCFNKKHARLCRQLCYFLFSICR